MAQLTVTSTEINNGVDYAEDLRSRKTAAEIESATTNANVFLEEVAPPVGFSTPAVFSGIKAQKVGNNFSCNLSPSDFIDLSTITNYLYVDFAAANNANNGTTWALAKKGIGHAIDAAIANDVDTIIYVRSGAYSVADSFNYDGLLRTISNTIAIIGVEGRVKSAPLSLRTWTQNATYSQVSECARNNVNLCLNPQLLDAYGEPTEYTIVSTLLDCANTAGSIYTDGTTLYCHTHSGNLANNLNCEIYLLSPTTLLNGGGNVYIENFDFVGGRYGGFFMDGEDTNTVVLVNSTFKRARAGKIDTALEPVSGVSVTGGKTFAAFNCEASFNSRDGFGFSKDGFDNKSDVLLVNCKGVNNSLDSFSSQSGNGFTTHDGIKSIDIGGVWLGSRGTNSGHIDNDTEVWSYGAIAGNSDGDIRAGGSIDWGAFGVWFGDAKMWLEHCTDNSAKKGIYSEVSGNAQYRSHKGQGVKIGATEFTR